MRNPATATRNNNGSKTPCCSKVGLKRGPWTPEEDELLVTYINKEGEGRWRTLPKRAGLLRCGKSCRLRWMNYLRPSVKRGQITPDEEDLILRLHRLLGNRWSLIAGRIPGRTDNEIKNYWNTHLRKKLISQGIDPTTHKPLKLNPQPQLKPSSSFSSSSKIPTPSIHPAASSSLEETSIMAMGDKLEENEYFQINRHYQTDDDAAAAIRGHGFTSLLNCDGSSGLEMIGSSSNQNQNQNQNQNLNRKISNDEEDEDVNYFTDDSVFSSFLNSLMNEDPFFTNHNQNQMQRQQSWEYIFHHDFIFNQNDHQEG